MMDNRELDTLTALRDNETRCVRILADCRRFAVNMSGAAGYYATFTQNEEVLLDAFALVVAAHSSPDKSYDHLFAQRWRRAGLTAADVQFLQTRLEQRDEDASHQE